MRNIIIILLLLCINLNLIPVNIEDQSIAYVCINTLAIIAFTTIYTIIIRCIKDQKAKENLFTTKESILISLLAIYQPISFYLNNIFEIKFVIGIFLCTVVYLYFIFLYLLFNLYLKNKDRALLIAILFSFLSLNFFSNIYLINYVCVFILYCISSVSLQKIKKPLIVFTIVLIILNTFVLINNTTKIIRAKMGYDIKTVQNITEKSDKNRDIYIILLDQYSGTNILEQKWGFNNSEFINALKDEGFYVFDKMYSNYNSTFASVPSILNLEYFENTKYLSSSSAIENATLYQIAKYNDYHTIFLKNSYFNLSPSNYLNFIPTTNGIYNTYDTLSTFFKENIYKNIINENMYGFLSKPDLQADIFISQIPDKKFVFMHMLMPHRPYLYDENGNKAKDKYNMEIGYLPYLKYTNNWTLNKIKELKNNSKNKPVIIITGDHGMRDDSIFESYFSTFTAYYNPEQEYSHIENDKTLINFFIDVTNYEFNINIPQKEPKIEFIPDPKDTLNDISIVERMNTAKDVTKQYLK